MSSKWSLNLNKEFKIFLIIFFIFLLYMIYQYKWTESPQGVPQSFKMMEIKKNPPKIKCPIPKLQPHDPLAVHLDARQFQNEGLNRAPDCVNGNSIKFYIDLNSNLIKLDPFNKFWKKSKCFYRSSTRVRDLPQITYKYGPIREITLTSTDLNKEFEYIDLTCYNTTDTKLLTKKLERSKLKIYEDQLFHVPQIPERKLPPKNSSKYSVVILGLDSVSHMSFIRHMPKSYKFLVKNLRTLEFEGYNTFNHFSWGNILPLLTGLTYDLARKFCNWETWKPVDKCPFLWRFFRKEGYFISTIDEMNQQMFPFVKRPFDLDFRDVFYTGQEGNPPTIGHHLGNNSLPCFGPRLAFKGQLDLLQKIVYRLENRPHFHFTWTHTLTHDINQYAQYGDDDLVSILSDLYKNKLMDNTFFILIGDHGARHGDLRQFSEQGFLEERLPLFLMTIPQGFRKKFPWAVKNMIDNTKKFVTVLDIYQTILDLLHMSRASQHQLFEKTQEKERGLSLFTRLGDRNCNSVNGQQKSYCICTERRKLDLNNAKILNAANFILNLLNQLLKNSSSCAQLKLKSITRATEVNQNEDDGKNGDQYFEFDFQTSPGTGHFSSHVKWNGETGQWENLHWQRISSFEKVNCVEASLRQFCFCKSEFRKINSIDGSIKFKMEMSAI